AVPTGSAPIARSRRTPGVFWRRPVSWSSRSEPAKPRRLPPWWTRPGWRSRKLGRILQGSPVLSRPDTPYSAICREHPVGNRRQKSTWNIGQDRLGSSLRNRPRLSGQRRWRGPEQGSVRRDAGTARDFLVRDTLDSTL